MKRKVQRCIALVMAAILLTTMAPEVICQAAEGAWEIVMNPETPLDEVYFHYKDSENKTYFYGYMDGKVAVMDENYKLIKKTEFNCINSTDLKMVKGVPAFVVSKKEGKKRLTGIISEKGDTILEPTYSYIYMRDNTIKTLQEQDVQYSYLYGLLDYSCKEILPCEYKRIDGETQIDGKWLVGTLDQENTYNVRLGEKVIWTGVQEEDTYISMRTQTYKGEDCIRVRKQDYRQDESISIYYYITYDGKILAQTDDTNNTVDEDDEETDGVRAKYEDAKSKWLDAKCEDGKKHVQEFYESKGKSIDKIKTSTGYDSKKVQTADSRQTKMYYWLEIEGTVSTPYWNEAEEEYEYKDEREVYYTYIYNENGDCLLSGRGFNIEIADEGEIDSYERQGLYVLRDDSMMCYLNRDDGNDGIEELYQVDDEKLASLSTYNKSGEHVIYYENGNIRDITDDTAMLFVYPEKKLYDYDYEYGDYCFIKGSSGTEIIHSDLDSDKKYSWWELDKMQGKVSWSSYGNLDLNIQDIKNAQIKTTSDGLIINDTKNKKIFFIWKTKQYSYSYEDLGIKDLETTSIVALDYKDGIYIKINQGQEVFYFYMNINTGTVKKLSVSSADDRIIQMADFNTVQQLDGKWYLYDHSGETDIACIDKANGTMQIIASNLVFDREIQKSDTECITESIDKLVVFNNQIHIQYKAEYSVEYSVEEDSGKHHYHIYHYYGVMDLSGNRKLDAVSWKITKLHVCDSYIVVDDKLYNSSFELVSKSIDYQLFYRTDEDESENLYRIYNYDNTSNVQSMLYSPKLEKIIYQCDKNEYLSSWEMLNGYYLVKWLLQNGTDYEYKRQPLLIDSDTGELVYKGYAYVYQDEKNQKIVVFENKKTDAAATPTPSAAATATPKPTSKPSVVRPSGPSTPVTPSSEPTPTVTPSPIATATATPSPTVAPTATPDITPSPTVEPTEEPEKTAEPIETATAAPTAAPSADVNDNGDTTSNSKKWKVGSKAADKTTNGVYQVTKLGKGRTVSYVRPIRKTSTATIPAAVTLQGKKYKVTAIQKKAFRNNKKLSRVVIGNNVTKIGANAFSGCKNLTEIVFGKKVTTISKNAQKRGSR